ncbi:class I SAM-dependent methyltransferase [Motilibacter deserti]|uniref:Class I SAM-dependent methyltransferase n=1 Tax=Motilibacter deserti TaxID=2714956 RepID=A0ABX0GWS0_9ACTN|nr:class I SAM-dependent methyltransferase [Motilibacter deserti]NHC15025.1 class I SAM-dependent methyltransferase [Motilibacter deserti]
MNEPRDWDLWADELSARALAAGQPTRWFEELYAAGRSGAVSMPWDRDAPHPLLQAWTLEHGVRGEGRSAVVVGCGLGADAEHLARLGFRTTAFDLAPTAIETARARHPGSSVDYRVADLLDLPPQWARSFDLVVEVFTLQALPDPPRAQAGRAVAGLVAPGGTLLAVAFRRSAGEPADEGPPFALTRADLAGLATDGLELVAIEEADGPRWRAEYRRV